MWGRVARPLQTNRQAVDTLTSLPPTVPTRGEFGFNAVRYTGKTRQRAGFTRTYRSNDLETCGAFRARIDSLARGFAAQGMDVTLLEEVRDGIVIQIEITTQHEPIAESITEIQRDRREADGRPSSTRGSRAGQFRN